MQRLASVVCTFVLLLFLSSTFCECRRPLLRRPRDSPTTGCYFVVPNEEATEEDVQELVSKVVRVSDDAKVHGMVHKVSKAFTVKLSPYALEMVRHMDAVDYIEEEGIAVGDEILPWYLDRIDQPALPLDLTYSPIGDGSGADIYIFDSGINFDHEEFEYRAKYGGLDPYDELTKESDPDIPLQMGVDCHGHGTHVSSLSGGKTFGSAKGVQIYSVRVLGCFNAAPWSVVLAGLDYVSSIAPASRRPSIVSMSLSGDFHRAVNDAVARVVAQGIHVITAAGNGQVDACSRSPASSSVAITVGGSKDDDGLYLLGSGTNFGSCVDIFAPGETILAADMDCSNCSKVLSGTSMSTPLVSGIAAIYLTRQPLLTPAQLKQKLIDDSVKNVLNYEGIPEEYWDVTANRLLTIPGSCGGKIFLRSHGPITSPNFPLPHPPNLDCEWFIEGDEEERIRFNLTYLNLEPSRDVFRIYDGPCCDQSSFVRELTGNQGTLSFSFLSSTNILCLKLKTDMTNNAIGFNGTYTKFYAGTDIQVPEDVDLPTVPPSTPRPNSDTHTIISTPPRQARSLTDALLNNGYHIVWATAYNTGPSFRPYLDVILTNSTQVDTRGFLDLTYRILNETIFQMEEEGYFVSFISDRRRGANPLAPSYSVVFVRRPDFIETEVFLRDSVENYLSRLATMRAEGYRLISHSFCHVQGRVETTSVYIRDKRLQFNITVGRLPRWESSYNLSFLDFTRQTLSLSPKKLYPSFIETNVVNGESRFSTIYLEQLVDVGTWYRWGVNTDAARATFEVEEQKWDPVITTSYNYNGQVSHFMEFQRRRYFY